MTIPAVTAGALIDPAWGNAVADAINDLQGTSWTTVPLGTNWSAFNSRTPQARVCNGIVEMRGMAISSVTPPSNDVVATLPVGMRPATAYYESFLVSAANTLQSVNLDVNTNGDIRLAYLTSTPTWGSNKFISFSGIRLTLL